MEPGELQESSTAEVELEECLQTVGEPHDSSGSRELQQPRRRPDGCDFLMTAAALQQPPDTRLSNTLGLQSVVRVLRRAGES